MRIPSDFADVNKDWLNTALRGTSPFPDQPLRGFNYETIGEGIGFMGEVFKLDLDYPGLAYSDHDSSNSNSKCTVVLKLPTQSDNRDLGETLGVYEREVRFYSELQPGMNVRTPTSFFAEMDEGIDPNKALGLLKFINRFPIKIIWWLFLLTQKFPPRKRNYALLLEDLSDLRPGNQVEGCSTEDAKVALAGMARLHSQYWNDPLTQKLPWVIPLELGAKAGQAVFRDCLPRYIEANNETLTPRHLELLNWLKENAIELYRLYNTLPSTLLHGDFRLDNIFFDDKHNEIVLCDWQTLMKGPAGLDLAYFLSASLDNNSNASDVTDLIAYYSDQLATHGIKIDQDILEWSYQAGMLIILHKVIPAEYQDMLELEGDRGHQLATTWIERVLLKLEKIDLQEVMRSII